MQLQIWIKLINWTNCLTLLGQLWKILNTKSNRFSHFYNSLNDVTYSTVMRQKWNYLVNYPGSFLNVNKPRLLDYKGNKRVRKHSKDKDSTTSVLTDRLILFTFNVKF